MAENTQTTDTAEREARRRWAALLGYDAAQAEAVATEDAEHRRALAQWLQAQDLDPAHAQDPRFPADPVTLSQWGSVQDVRADVAAEKWPTLPGFPDRSLLGTHPVSGAAEAAERAAEEFGAGERVSGAEFARRAHMSKTTVNRTLRDHAEQAPARDGARQVDAHALAAFLAAVRTPGPSIYSLATLEAWPRPARAPRVDPARFDPEERVTYAEFARRTGKDADTVRKAVGNPAYAEKAPERGPDGTFDARELARFVASLPGRRGRPRKAG
ncbi:hypothetical protein [Nocardiopsis tropica]|uniref:Uncharacterized protein n=1 Tax=Nocardiopsis tropica TaxID=109330 RepID=A0ABU7KR71_9ACTN|nr:hypothetical protein [Nocardiopsis umidischolae]MEE2051784.1 hypothetical protein [Nocardiopsis umidischolae]